MFKLRNDIDLKKLEQIGFYLEGNTYKKDVRDHYCIAICINPKANGEIILPPEENQEVRETIEELDFNNMLEWSGFDAETMYYTTKYNINSKRIEVLKNIIEEIEERAAACHFDLFYKYKTDYSLENDIVEELRKLGFKVKIISANFDDYGNYYPDYLKISWKNTNNNEKNFSVKNKIKKFFKRKG